MSVWQIPETAYWSQLITTYSGDFRFTINLFWVAGKSAHSFFPQHSSQVKNLRFYDSRFILHHLSYLIKSQVLPPNSSCKFQVFPLLRAVVVISNRDDSAPQTAPGPTARASCAKHPSPARGKVVATDQSYDLNICCTCMLQIIFGHIDNEYQHT